MILKIFSINHGVVCIIDSSIFYGIIDWCSSEVNPSCFYVQLLRLLNLLIVTLYFVKMYFVKTNYLNNGLKSIL